jgi:hypothetical protein
LTFGVALLEDSHGNGIHALIAIFALCATSAKAMAMQSTRLITKGAKRSQDQRTKTECLDGSLRVSWVCFASVRRNAFDRDFHRAQNVP